MLHRDRIWGPPRLVTQDELAVLLTEHSWTLCSAFEHQGYLYLNDSTGEDRAQEYAIVKRRGEEFRQVESITFSWCDRRKALRYIERVSRGDFDEREFAHRVLVRFDLSDSHRCLHCR